MRFIITFLVFLVAFTAQADDWGKNRSSRYWCDCRAIPQ
ncbi:hypothetical protein JCM19314_738 [Nonlabens ulvanivorans]|uniref:Uncharacterized protein n=1 Tax=Nonlabens ulvanivorans TaxID=906888 RepID=A0A081DGI9_NONUL|nr:hypothetical protein JCM19296_3644 [Nonlabens ulvanivorans]GAL01294.1 hypothetical protein JCM19314_738 [Nonlabens ulvanivorans]